MDSRGDPVLCRQLEPARAEDSTRAEDSMSRIGGCRQHSLADDVNCQA